MGIKEEKAPAVRAAQCSATAEPRWTVQVQLRQMRIDAKCKVQRECKSQPVSLSMRCTRAQRSTVEARQLHGACSSKRELGTEPFFEPFLALRGQVTLR